MDRSIEEKIYAGVLGKIIGVYHGRPVEGWSYERIMETFGEIDYFVNGKMNLPIMLPDDDISGTFAFFRALEDNGYPRDLSPRLSARPGSTTSSRKRPSCGGAASVARPSTRRSSISRTASTRR